MAWRPFKRASASESWLPVIDCMLTNYGTIISTIYLFTFYVTGNSGDTQVVVWLERSSYGAECTGSNYHQTVTVYGPWTSPSLTIAKRHRLILGHYTVALNKFTNIIVHRAPIPRCHQTIYNTELVLDTFNTHSSEAIIGWCQSEDWIVKEGDAIHLFKDPTSLNRKYRNEL